MQENFPPPITHTPRVTVCEPENPNVVYIGCLNDGVWKSANGGDNWDEKNTGITNFRPHVFEINPVNSQILYLGCHWPGSGESGCCFKTTNGGDQWNDISPVVDDPGALAIYDIEIDPNSPNYVFMCGKGAPPGTPFVFKSTDGGNSWTSAYQGIEGTCLYSLAIDPDDGDIVYGGGAYHAPSMGIWKTTNGGSSWAKVYDLGKNCLALTILEVGANKYIFAATEGQKVFRSSNEGLTWQQLGTGIYDPSCWSILADQPTLSNPNGAMYLGTMRCFYRSTDMGQSWKERMTGMHVADVRAVTANLPTLNCKSHCYGSGRGDVIHRSFNTGAEWQFVKAMPSGCMRTDILTDPSDDSRIHAVNADVDNNGQIWQSTDGGENWHIVYEIGGPPSAYFYCLAVNPLSPRIWYAGGDKLGSFNYSVMKSINAGNNWVPVGDWPGGFGPKVYSILVDPLINDILYLGEIVNGVQKSTDGGLHWFLANDGLPYPITVNALAMPVINNNILFAGSNQGIYKTTDAADNWGSSSNGLDYTFVKSLCEDPDEPSLIYAACQENENSTEGYVYASVDYGARWFNLSTGLPQALVNDLTLDVDNTEYVFAATKQGVYTYTPDFNKSLVSSSDEATFANNGRKMVRNGNSIWITYESGGAVYVVHSDDNGQSWSKKREMGKGYNPCMSMKLIQIPSGPTLGVVWWAQGTRDTLYFSKYSSGSWGSPTAIVTSNNDFSPPSFVLHYNDYGHMVYVEGGSYIKYTKFDINGVSAPQTYDVDTGDNENPSIGYMSSLGNPEIHIVYKSGGRLYYKSRTGSTWNDRELIIFGGTHPCLEVVGTVVHIVCHVANNIRHYYTVYTGGPRDWNEEQVNNSDDYSDYPVITSGSACSWVEDGGTNKEIVYSWNSPLGWSSADTISDTDECSDYPYFVHKQTIEGTVLYFTWTEKDAVPYHIEFTSRILGVRENGEDPDLIFYLADAGEKVASSFNRRRESYTQYGPEFFKKIDYDSKYLEYQFEGLSSENEYALTVYAYQRDFSNLNITVKADNAELAKITIPEDTLIMCKKMLPIKVYADSVVNVKIFGEKALCAALVLHEYEEESKGGGPQSSETMLTQFGQLTLSMYPNPTKKAVRIEYNLPAKMGVKLSIYDVTGRLVKNIVNENQDAGFYHESFDMTDLSQGVYFVKLNTGDKSIIEKVIFLR